MILTMNLGADSYDIVIEKGSLSKVDSLIDLNRKVMIVSDDGVPKQYIDAVKNKSKDPYVFIFKQGEDSKSLDTYREIIEVMLKNNFTRKDAVVAVGGGVSGDLSGFVASTYMRGIDFYNIPTTSLAQIDSSIGGKTAINFGGYKNMVGAFYQPKKVVIDTDTLDTLTEKQLNSGLVEAFKMSCTSNKELYDLFLNEDIYENLETIIIESLKIKKAVVEEDEKENGLRKILNFGHTVGHGIEANTDDLYHGECVALGMLTMCSDNVRQDIIKVLNKLNIETEISLKYDDVLSAISHDKKSHDNTITLVKVNEPGSFVLCDESLKDIRTYLSRCIKEA